MSFTSPLFLFVFFPAVIAGHYLLLWLEGRAAILRRWRLHDWWTVLAGLGFYAFAGLRNTLLLIGYTVVVWLLGKLCARFAGKKTVAALSVAALLAVLVLFKYLPAYITGLQAVLTAPLGLSFITFSAISYLMDIYWGKAASGSLLDCGLYLTFFGKIASGPTVLWRDFSGYLTRRTYTLQGFTYGLERLCLGFAKKIILADTFGAVIADITAWQVTEAASLWGCALLYMLQLYYDFSGYSDIALGLSSIFGFALPENFRFPYLSTSITEFWRRWHISLGAFFREYVYFPLGGSRKGRARTCLNLALIFILSGIWHGNGLGYLCWGLIHAICRVAEFLLADKPIYRKTPTFVKWLLTMGVIFVSWQFLRFGSLYQTLVSFAGMFGLLSHYPSGLTFSYFFTPKVLMLMGIALLGATLPATRPAQKLAQRLHASPGLYLVKMLGLFILMGIAVIFMVNAGYSPFLYFQY